VDFADNDCPQTPKNHGGDCCSFEVYAGLLATAAAHSESDARWLPFHTGDMATITRMGRILIRSKKDSLVSGRENISSLEVEKALNGASRGLRGGRQSSPKDEKWAKCPRGWLLA